MAASGERSSQPLLSSILDTLGEEIVSGEMPEGHTFTLHDLSERFDISRTVAREAMRALEQPGDRADEGGLARSGLTRDDDDLVVSDRLDDLLTSLGDGQVRRVVENERSALLRVRCGSLGYGGRGRIH